MRPNPSCSRSVRRAGTLAALGVLAGCSLFPPLPTADQARTRMVGMSAAQATSCLGQPGTNITAPDGHVIWTFTPTPDAMGGPVPASDPSRMAFGYSPFAGSVGNPGFADASAPPPMAQCRLVLRLQDGRVSDVAYIGANDSPLPQSDQCGALAAPCMK